jgi:bifunctional UDP-N-acetylglucosamine pyrophosphorylase/glucosamine-1-phosphate N-acetyltransferase
MDGIILAGGKGTRMLPLTENTPKPLLQVSGKPILEWSLLCFRPSVDHVLVVVKHLKEQIIRFMQQQTIFEDYTIVEQLPEPLGTGHAVQCCKSYLHSDEFIVTNGDDLCSAAALQKLSQKPVAILSVERNDPEQWGVLVTDETGYLTSIHEKPPATLFKPPVQVNAGVYKLNTSIFEHEISRSARGEYELTDYVSWLSQNSRVSVVPADFWLPIGNPDDFRKAQQLDLAQKLFVELPD